MHHLSKGHKSSTILWASGVFSVGRQFQFRGFCFISEVSAWQFCAVECGVYRRFGVLCGAFSSAFSIVVLNLPFSWFGGSLLCSVLLGGGCLSEVQCAVVVVQGSVVKNFGADQTWKTHGKRKKKLFKNIHCHSSREM